MSSPEARWAALALAVTTAVQALYSMLMFAAPVLAPAASGDVGVPASAIGIFTPVMYGGAMVAAAFGSITIDRYGPLRMNQAALVLGAVAGLLALTASPWLVIVAAFVIGLGYGPMTPASSIILVPRSPVRWRATILSVKQTGVPGGGALAGALVPLMILVLGWRGAVAALVVLCVLAALAIQPTRAEFDRGHPLPARPVGARALLEPLRLLFGDPRLRELGLVGFVFSSMQIGSATFLVVYTTQELGMTLVGAGAVLAAGMAAGVAGRIVWGLVSDWMRDARRLIGLLGLGMCVGLLGLAAAAPGWPVAAVFLFSVLTGGTTLGWNGVFVAELARVAPEGRIAAATGAAMTLCYAGVVLMPPLMLVVYRMAGSYGAAYFFGACVTLVPTLSLLLRSRRA